MKRKIKIFYISAFILLLIIVFITAIDLYISKFSSPHLFDDCSKIPENKCGLLLGTSKYSIYGGINPYFSSRLDAAAKLYHSGKVRYIIASGDNSEVTYNEPRFMAAGLKERGIPAERIFLDYAGFRTLDSIVRGREIFGQNSVTVISQRFHNERAVYIGRSYGISAIGFNADDVKKTSNQLVRLREFFCQNKGFY
jgi:SanA protein